MSKVYHLPPTKQHTLSPTGATQSGGSSFSLHRIGRQRFDDCRMCEGTGYTDMPMPEEGWTEVECSTCKGSGYGDLGLIMRSIITQPDDVTEWIKEG